MTKTVLTPCLKNVQIRKLNLEKWVHGLAGIAVKS